MLFVKTIKSPFYRMYLAQERLHHQHNDILFEIIMIYIYEMSITKLA